MKFEEFEALYQKTKTEHPIWFGLESDPAATMADVERTQGSLGIRLPPEYVGFVRHFGGGFFGFVTVYSVTAGSPFNIQETNNRSPVPKGFLAFSDNGTGDFYCFKVVNSQCTSRVFFIDHEEKYASFETEFCDLFEFLAKKALSPVK